MKFQLLLVSLFSALQASAQSNYILFHPNTNYRENIVRIYIDRAGNVYPSSNNIDSTKFPSISRKSRSYSNLRDYFASFDKEAGQQVFKKYGVENFEQLQEKLISSIADSINKKLGKRKLVVLIHGFNDYAVRGYDSLKNRIDKELATEKPLYLEVYWDGLKATSEKGGDVSKIWFRANKTAPYAALTLRKLFARIGDANTYIIAHSLGACVASRLLFNTKDRKLFPLKKEWKKLPTPAQSQITIAILAPAIPGKRVFKTIAHTVPQGKSDHYTKLVIGYNKYDYATTKGCRFPFSRMFYSTALGCNPGTVRRTGMIAKKKCKQLDLRTTDFSTCTNSNETHHVHHYVLCDAFPDFIKAIFAEK